MKISYRYYNAIMKIVLALKWKSVVFFLILRTVASLCMVKWGISYCGVQLQNSFLVNVVQKLSKLVKMCKSYCNMFTAIFFMDHSVYLLDKHRFVIFLGSQLACIIDCLTCLTSALAEVMWSGSGHIPSLDIPLPCNSSSLFTWCRTFPPFHHHHPPVYNIKRSTVNAYKIDRGSIKWVSVSFRKIPHLAGWLGPGRYVVGRLGSGMRVSATFQIFPRPVGRLGLGSEPQVVGRLGSRLWISASFQIFASTTGGCFRWRGKLSKGGNVHRKCPTLMRLAWFVCHSVVPYVYITQSYLREIFFIKDRACPSLELIFAARCYA